MDKRLAFGGFGVLGLIILVSVALLFVLSFFYLDLRNTKTLLEETLEEKEAQVAKLEDNLARVDNLLLCEDISTEDLDYSGNLEMSESLMSWVEDYWEPVHTNDWDVLWSSSRTTMHTVLGDFGYYFLVFYDDPEVEKFQGVFWIYGQCWIDLPENGMR